LIPVKDENPTSITPLLTWLLIGLNIGVFIWEVTDGVEHFNTIVASYGLIPASVLNKGEYLTLITSIFLHGGWLHLVGNMLYLYIFGDNVEDMCGHLHYLLFYLICGISASAAHIFAEPGSEIPAVGASGAISGVLGAYVVLFPKVRIKTAVTLGWFIHFVSIPAYILVGTWFIYQFLLATLGLEVGVAYWAHVGGFIAGVVLGRAFASRKRYHPMYKDRTYWRR